MGAECIYSLGDSGLLARIRRPFILVDFYNFAELKNIIGQKYSQKYVKQC